MNLSTASFTEPKAKARFNIKRLALSLFLSLGYGSIFLHLFLAFGGMVSGLLSGLGAFGAPALWVLLQIVTVPLIYRHLARHGSRRAVVAAEILAFIALPLIGTLYDYLAGPGCVETECDTVKVHRPFALPELAHLWILHAVTIVAYAISRRRTEVLPARVELFVLGAMTVGCVLQLLLGIQLRQWMFYGLAGTPILLCAASPLFAFSLFSRELSVRLRQNARLGFTVSGMLGAAIGLFGIYGLVEAIVGRHKGAALDVVTRTCGFTFSHLPVVQQPCSGHYLCTVAACGHPALVKPLRLGTRAGQPIIVNRQLAIANAFEDLLHERFPHFGRVARRTYDRLALPVARLIRHRLLADAVYLLMKPAEWGFYVFLLLVDPSDPEKRLCQMYTGK